MKRDFSLLIEVYRQRRHMSSKNSNQVKRLLLEGFGADRSVLDEVVAPDFTGHQPGLPQGRGGLKHLIRTLRQSFSDLKLQGCPDG
jgi:hypothetical protein